MNFAFETKYAEEKSCPSYGKHRIITTFNYNIKFIEAQNRIYAANKRLEEKAFHLYVDTDALNNKLEQRKDFSRVFHQGLGRKSPLIGFSEKSMLKLL